MAIIKKFSAVKKIQEHLLGIQNLSIKEAPIAEPCAVALHAVELGQKEIINSIKDIKVLIIGAGAIGLLCGLILSKVKDCKNIMIVEPNDKRMQETLKYLDADGVKPDSKSIISDNFDLVLDTVGLEKTRLQFE